MRTRSPGFTLIEILVAMLLLSIAMAAVVPVLATQSRANLEQDTKMAMQENLRVGMSVLTDTLRNGRYGVPSSNISTWINWVSGFTTNPTITTSGSNSIVTIASATAQSVTTLSSAAAVGTTTLSLASLTPVNTGSKGLLLINGQENAVVTAVNASSVTIDTDPTASGNQGLAHAYPAGTPVYRVDVTKFTVATDSTTGFSSLFRDQNQGVGALAVVDGISGLQLATVSANKQYTLTLTATSTTRDPVTNQYLSASLASDVTMAN